MRTGRLILLLGWVLTRSVSAQQDSVTGLIVSARRLTAAQQLDSAAVLLNRAADKKSGGTAADRAQALVLLGVVRFYQGQDSLTAQAFQAALVLDTSLHAGGLAQIDSVLPRLFDDARVRAVAAVEDAARQPHFCVRKCPPGEVAPRLLSIPQLVVLDSGPDFINTHAMVAVLLVVSEEGMPEPATIRISSSTMPTVNAQVLDVVRGARFRPALANGSAVRALVELRFEFRAEGMSAVTYRIEGP